MKPLRLGVSEKLALIQHLLLESGWDNVSKIERIEDICRGEERED